MRRLIAALSICSMLACVEVPPSADGGSTGGGSVGASGGGSGGGGGGGTNTGGGTASGGGTGGGSISTDVTAPELLDTTPSTGSMNVAVGQPLQLIFSEPMEPASVQLTATPAITFGGPAGNSSGTLFTIAHGPLRFDTSYAITIAGADLAGNALTPEVITFRTEAAPDTAAPTLVRSIPASASTGVAVASPVVLTFSEPMDRATVQIVATPSTSFGPFAFAENDSEVTLNALADLTPNTSYSLSIRGSDVSGNALAQQTLTFTTQAPRDTTPPALTSSTPSSGQTNVATTTRLSFTFSEAIAPASLSVAVSPSIDLGLATFSNQDRTATFSTPAADLTAARSFTVTVEADDLAGNALPATNFTFTTAAPPDTVRPTVSSTSPTAGATGVPANSNLEFNFSERMNEAATEAAFTSTPVIATRTFTWNAAGTLMSVNPGADLPSGASVTMTVGTAARDLAGNTLAAARSVTFTTAAAPDTTRPSVVAVAPLQGAVGVAPASTITVTFSEPMRQAATQTAFQIISPTGFNGGTFSWNSTSTQVTYNPPNDFVHGTLVQYAITTAAEDLAGNGLLLNASRNFQVKRRATQNFYAFGITDVTTTDARAGRVRTNGSCASATVTTSSNATAGDEEQGFMTFSLAPLETLDGVNILSAVLNVEQLGCVSLGAFGAPIDSPITLSHVNYGPSLTLGDCGSPTLGGRDTTLSGTATAGRKIEFVTTAVRDDFFNRVARGNRSQWRVHTTRTGGLNFCVYATQNNSTNHPFIRIGYEFD